MENEYNIPMNDEWREEVRQMCNLSQGIEQGITQQKQNTISFIKEMQKKGWSAEEILASLTNIEIE